MNRSRRSLLLTAFAAASLALGGSLLFRARAAAQAERSAASAAAALKGATGDLESSIVSFANGEVGEKGAFGEFRKLLGGETRSLKDLMVGTCVLEPGQRIHPAHQHADEEFLYVAKGEGTWHLNGKDSAAHEGDVLYIKPWDLHGITNTGKERLTFFVVKWNGRQLPVPEKPAGSN